MQSTRGVSEKAQSSGEDPRLMSTHILCIDDDPNVRKVESVRLKRLGYSVTTHPDAESALKALDAGSVDVDLMLVDFKMPGMNGGEFAREVRTRGLGQPLVLMTGYRAEVPEHEVREAGFDAILHKPVSSDALASVLEDLL